MASVQTAPAVQQPGTGTAMNLTPDGVKEAFMVNNPARNPFFATPFNY
jgi:hypothetical protein